MRNLHPPSSTARRPISIASRPSLNPYPRLSPSLSPPSPYPRPSRLPATLETLPPLVTQPPPELARDDRIPGVAVTKHKTWWSERFQFTAVARLEASTSTAAILPYEDLDGLNKYFTIGDTLGWVYVFSSTGDVLLELPSNFDSPATSLLCYLSSHRYESLLFIGQADGSISAHRLWESAATGDD